MRNDEPKGEGVPSSKDAWFRLLPSNEAHNGTIEEGLLESCQWKSDDY